MKTVEHKYTWGTSQMETIIKSDHRMTKLEPSSRSNRLELEYLSEGLPIVLKPASYVEDFNRFLLEAVDDGLSSLGSIAKQAVYIHLKKKFNINKEDIPNRFDEFTAAIEEIFGVGAQLIEIQIMKNLYEKVGCFCRHFPKQDHLVFGEYVETTRSLCHSCSKLA